ncbi:MAG: sulfite exporter TauE/SafE family protein [Candidatus Bathyarchaeota archaeon]|nr:sulfite exporter TauE/SafE family protein [Candidatus Bathyarchaeota archaeon]
MLKANYTCPHLVIKVALILLSYGSLALFAFAFGVIDGSFGMGYGTLLVPMLLILGLNPLQVVPAVLISQFVGDFLAAFFHHIFENADLSFGSVQFRIAMMFAVLGIASSVIAVIITINLPSFYLSLYIGTSTVLLGFLILVVESKERVFSWIRITILGSAASFNKGVTGGGYGPIITAGQILTGVDVKTAIGITSLAEGVTCAAAALTYFITHAQNIDWLVPLMLTIGVAVSCPVSGLIVRKTAGKRMKTAIGLATIAVGLLTTIKILSS